MNINRGVLTDYRKPSGWENGEQLYMTGDHKYCIFFYNINEVRMMTYLSTFAVFSADDPTVPLVVMDSKECRTWYILKKSFDYAPVSDIIVTRYTLDFGHVGVNCIPFLLIMPTDKKFAIVPFDFTSIYYGIREVSKGVLALTELHPQDIDRCVATGKHKRQTGRILKTDELTWYPLTRLQDLKKICKHKHI